MHELDFPSCASSSGSALHPNALEDAVQEASMQSHTTKAGAHSQNLVLSGESYRAVHTAPSAPLGVLLEQHLEGDVPGARLKTKHILS